jgi:hypothetical protein
MEAVDTTGSKTIFQSMTSEKNRSPDPVADRAPNREENPPCSKIIHAMGSLGSDFQMPITKW